jgi:hypothetical protein
MAKARQLPFPTSTRYPGGTWASHSVEPASSKAWRLWSVHLVRLLDKIDVESARAGRESGSITAAEAATQAVPADLTEVEFRAFAGAPYYLELSHEGRRFRMKEQARKSNGHLKPREEHD